MAHRLSDSEIQAQASQLEGWKLEGKHIQCRRTFRDFVAAIAFVNQLAEPSENAGHHPDRASSYNQMMITRTTHDVKGLTEKDFELAKVISQLH